MEKFGKIYKWKAGDLHPIELYSQRLYPASMKEDKTCLKKEFTSMVNDILQGGQGDQIISMSREGNFTFKTIEGYEYSLYYTYTDE